jgi:hypothetical protein
VKIPGKDRPTAPVTLTGVIESIQFSHSSQQCEWQPCVDVPDCDDDEAARLGRRLLAGLDN